MLSFLLHKINWFIQVLITWMNQKNGKSPNTPDSVKIHKCLSCINNTKLTNAKKGENIMPKARYRVSINGFRCNQESYDDATQTDGKRDEVFLATSVKTVNKNGVVTFTADPTQSMVMGDTNNQNGRIQAGSAAGDWWGPSKGGIRSGDSFPPNNPWQKQGALHSSAQYPPMFIWEGDLEKGEDVLYVLPTIWEWDIGKNFWQDFINGLQQIDVRYGEKAKLIVTPAWPQATWVFPAISLGIETINTVFSLMGTPGTRAIGSEAKVLVLKYESAEFLITQDIGMGPGVISMNYVDGIASYSIYLQVEKIKDYAEITPLPPHILINLLRPLQVITNPKKLLWTNPTP